MEQETATTNLDLRNSHNRPFKAAIDGAPCKGRVSVNKNKNVFLCQNEEFGWSAEDKLGYIFSWWVQAGRDEQTNFWLHSITDFEFITEEELNADAPPSLDGKEIELKIDGVSYQAVLKLKS